MAAALAAALALGAVLGQPASANVTQSLHAMPIHDVCEHVPDGYAPFADVTSAARPHTSCLAYAAVTQGATANRYLPAQQVTRDQMASFIARMLDSAAQLELDHGLEPLPAYDGRNRFADVSSSSPHVASINRLAAAGIALGGPGGTPADRYAPRRTVSRGQMATFITRGVGHLVGGIEAADRDYFRDDGGDAHQPNINVVAEYGIAVGDGMTTFSPASSLTRAQMAAFIVRTLATLEFAELITPLPVEG